MILNMSDLLKNVETNKEPLVLQCIQALLEDSVDPIAMNHFETSAPYLMEFFGSNALIIFALDEDKANKELYIDAFSINKSNVKKAHPYRKRLSKNYEKKQSSIMKDDESAFSIFEKNSHFTPLFDLDFGKWPIIMHHLRFNGRIIGGISYSVYGINIGSKNFEYVLPIIKLLTSLVLQRHAHIEQKLKLETLQQVIDLVPQRVFWKNRDGEYLGCNTALVNDSDYSSSKDLIGKTAQEVFKNTNDEVSEEDIRTMKYQEVIINVEMSVVSPNKKLKWFRVSKSPLENKLNEVIGTVGTYDEITELKDIQIELQNSKDHLEDRVNERTLDLELSNLKLKETLKELKKAQNHLIEIEKMAALGNLVAGISHEINTPIGVSVTAASHLQETIAQLQKSFSLGELTEKHFNNSCSIANDCSQMLLNNLERASDLIKSFKQIAIDQSHDKPRKIKLNEYVKNILATLAPVLKNKDIELEVDIEEKLNLITFPGVFAQIVTNITENAMKHAFPDNEINAKFRIHCYLTDKNIHIHFIDNGVGIPQNLRTKIFEPFFTTKGKSGGSGLGLSIVYNIICQKFNGSIKCESCLGKGTDFHITIPKQHNLCIDSE
jgi:two-component system autoinducer 2 sensor kinase/phosphatase LuxQ